MYTQVTIGICVCFEPASVVVDLESLAAQHVAAAKPVPGSLMVRRPGREESLML